jgi:HK97 family phage prohead protease
MSKPPIRRALVVERSAGPVMQEGRQRWPVIASTSEVDSYGDIVEQTWDLSRFAANPVLLFGHRYDQLPVGRAELAVEDGALRGYLEFDDSHELAIAVGEQWAKGFLNAVSVGFYPGRSVSRSSLPDGDPRKADRGYVLSDNHLLELSVVPIPANPGSLGVRGYDAAGCLQRGLPAPGDEGAVLDAVLAEAPALVVERVLADPVLTERIAAAVRGVLAQDGSEDEAEPPPADPFADWWGAQSRDEWAEWYASEGEED